MGKRFFRDDKELSPIFDELTKRNELSNLTRMAWREFIFRHPYLKELLKGVVMNDQQVPENNPSSNKGL